MKKLFLLFLSIVILIFIHSDSIFPGIYGRPLIDSLVKYYKSYSNLGYNNARDTLYGKIDKVNDTLEGAYGGYRIYMDPTEDPSSWAYDHGINCEHTWPQSLGADTGLPEGDMHHLFPCEIGANGDRGSLPFGDVDDNSTDRWYIEDTYYTSKPTSNIDAYSERLDNVNFEVREEQKGRTARAMFYFYTMYEDYYLNEDSDTSFFNGQKDNLYLWHTQYIADGNEINRTNAIANYQEGKPNPYVLDSTLVRRAFFPELGIDKNKNCIARIELFVITHNSININYHSNNKINNANIYIFDIIGKKIYSSRINIHEGDNTEIIKLNNMKSGQYFIIIKHDNSIILKKRFILL